MKQVFIDIKTKIEEITSINLVTAFNGQYFNTQKEQGYNYPIALIEFANIEYVQQPKQVQKFDANCIIHIVYNSYEFEPLGFYDVRDLIFLKLQGFKPENCSEMYRVSEIADTDHDALYIYKVDFKISGIDIVANTDNNLISHTVTTLATTKDLEIDNNIIRTGTI